MVDDRCTQVVMSVARRESLYTPSFTAEARKIAGGQISRVLPSLTYSRYVSDTSLRAAA